MKSRLLKFEDLGKQQFLLVMPKVKNREMPESQLKLFVFPSNDEKLQEEM